MIGDRERKRDGGGRGGREGEREEGSEAPDDVGCGGRAREQVMGVRDRNQLVPQQLDAQSAAVVDQLLDLVTRAPEEIDRELRYGRTSPSSSPSIASSKGGDAWEAPAANEQVKSRVCHVCLWNVFRMSLEWSCATACKAYRVYMYLYLSIYLSIYLYIYIYIYIMLRV